MQRTRFLYLSDVSIHPCRMMSQPAKRSSISKQCAHLQGKNDTLICITLDIALTKYGNQKDLFRLRVLWPSEHSLPSQMRDSQSKQTINVIMQPFQTWVYFADIWLKFMNSNRLVSNKSSGVFWRDYFKNSLF